MFSLKLLKLYVLLYFLIVTLSYAESTEENAPCKTPNGLNGFCINVKHCQQIVNLLYNLKRNPENVDYIKKSQCGRNRQNNIPLVCCASTITGKSLPMSEAPKSSTISLPSTDICGPFADGEFPRVVGGFDAQRDQFPWMAALGYRNKKNNTDFLCAGSIITKRHILTAAHCVYRRPDLYLIRYGILNLYTDPNPIDVEIVDKRPHPEYDETHITNDIAILKVENDIQFLNTPLVRPICLPDHPTLRAKTFEKKFPFLAGWGSLYFHGPSSDRLQGLQLPIVPNERCKSTFASFKTAVIDNRVICAAFARGGKDACKGDSGGPLMFPEIVDDDLHFYQIGVISYGYRCAEPGYPGVYTRVTEYIDWIKSQLY